MCLYVVQDSMANIVQRSLTVWADKGALPVTFAIDRGF